MNFDDIKDELCYCGALKSQHKGINGHGPCIETDCKQFTWKKFIMKTKAEKKKGPRKYGVLLDGNLMDFEGQITFTKYIAETMAKTIKGQLVEVQITQAVQ